MAYPTICKPCREERHDGCLKSAGRKDGTIGGWVCVCSHGKGEQSAFEQHVREQLEQR